MSAMLSSISPRHTSWAESETPKFKVNPTQIWPEFSVVSAIVRPLKEIQTNIIIQYYSHVLKRRGEALKAKSCSGPQVNHKCAGRCQQDILLKGFIAFVLIFCQQANHMCEPSMRRGNNHVLPELWPLLRGRVFKESLCVIIWRC